MDVKAVAANEAERINVLGIPHAVLVEGDEVLGNYEILEITGDTGMGVPLHVHDKEDETFYVAEGEVAFLTKDGEVTGTAGMCVNLPRKIPHGYRIEASGSRMVLTVSPGRLVPMFRELGNLPPGEPNLDDVSSIIEKYDVHFA